MTAEDKRRFIGELIDAVTITILARVDQMPEEWDGIELRRYIADTFMEQTMHFQPGRIRSGGHQPRFKAYRDAIIARNL